MIGLWGGIADLTAQVEAQTERNRKRDTDIAAEVARTCPSCKAPAGMPCQTKTGRTDTHPQRTKENTLW
jgi:hypothetical protein